MTFQQFMSAFLQHLALMDPVRIILLTASLFVLIVGTIVLALNVLANLPEKFYRFIIDLIAVIRGNKKK
jgi:hypothetical protein